jgi:hypothetical protein
VPWSLLGKQDDRTRRKAVTRDSGGGHRRGGGKADLARQRTGPYAQCLPEVIRNGSFDFRALRWLDVDSAIEDSARLCPGNDRAS